MSGILNFIKKKKFLNKDLQEFFRINFSFYKYFYVDDPFLLKKIITRYFDKLKIFGRIYISSEGINVQGNILKKYFYKMKCFIYKLHPKLNNLHINIGIDNTRQSFLSLKIKIKKKIVDDGLKENILQKKYNKKYLNAYEVNKFLKKKDVIFLDVRNYYEYRIGHFKNAISTYTFTFRDHLKKIFNYISMYKNRKIVLYCTGGIRCEKTAFLIQKKGYKKVYQIYGGIIGYINECKKKKLPMKFLGNNFVFDLRLNEFISRKKISYCGQCFNKSDYYINCMNPKCNLLFIQCFLCSRKYKSFCSKLCLKKFQKKK
ncbi:rhodanese-related sulfurtransferase [Buchnera aphidicola]|uniref:oxygen-dependent tRNA uridine(34) hydroxylase TrhO n=1 Tax=Buchnera aphidicola TaxID=9 RepID=UPI0034649E69